MRSKDARLCQPSPLCRIVFVFFLVVAARPALAATSYATPNFVVYAPSAEVARKIALAAEHYRKVLAMEWLGHPLPRWSQPCPVKVKLGQIGAGGATTFTFHPTSNGSAEVCGWDMQIQGSLERILDSVLPHEVSHTIFACHFRRPLPRWADEGAATLVEHESERRRQVLAVKQVLGTRRRIPLKQLLVIKEYPKDMQDILTLYAEGYTLAELLVQKGGRARYLKFLADAHNLASWDRAIAANYEYQGVDDLEKDWQNWVVAGCPEIKLPDGQLLADRGRNGGPAEQQIVMRGQNPTDDPFLENTVQPARPAGSQEVAAALPPAKPLRLPLESRTDARDDRTPLSPPAADEPGPRRARGRSVASEKAAHADASFVAAGSTALTSALRARHVRSRSAEPATDDTDRETVACSEFPIDPRPSPLARTGKLR
ncbi:MAG: hypothetical protein ACT4QC_06980 [Planctomycetaceae bacterium]